MTPGRWQRLGTRSFVWFLEKALPGMSLPHRGAEVPSWVHGGSCKEASFPFLPLFPPQAPAGRSEARRPGAPGLGNCTQCWGCEGGPQLLPILLGQVGLHVKEDVLPLLDVGTHLLKELRFLPTGMAFVPEVRGVGMR